MCASGNFFVCSWNKSNGERCFIFCIKCCPLPRGDSHYMFTRLMYYVQCRVMYASVNSFFVFYSVSNAFLSQWRFLSNVQAMDVVCSVSSDVRWCRFLFFFGTGESCYKSYGEHCFIYMLYRILSFTQWRFLYFVQYRVKYYIVPNPENYFCRQ